MNTTERWCQVNLGGAYQLVANSSWLIARQYITTLLSILSYLWRNIHIHAPTNLIKYTISKLQRTANCASHIYKTFGKYIFKKNIMFSKREFPLSKLIAYPFILFLVIKHFPLIIEILRKTLDNLRLLYSSDQFI
jgi:hypothetical protein